MKHRYFFRAAIAISGCLAIGACGGNGEGAGSTVETSGKVASELAAVPEEVLLAVREARPELEVNAAEHELRNGQDYWDIGGNMPDGSELELDLTTVEGAWTVVEIQRDISLQQVPVPVREALEEGRAGWNPHRIIESDQGDGVVIYEFFGRGTGGEEAKAEVKWEQGAARLLADEWVH